VVLWPVSGQPVAIMTMMAIWIYIYATIVIRQINCFETMPAALPMFPRHPLMMADRECVPPGAIMIMMRILICILPVIIISCLETMGEDRLPMSLPGHLVIRRLPMDVTGAIMITMVIPIFIWPITVVINCFVMMAAGHLPMLHQVR